MICNLKYHVYMDGLFYHCVNRGVEKRDIVTTQKDALRFVANLVELNTTKHALQTSRQVPRSMAEMTQNTICDSEQLVDIHGWCLMKNHYHILLSEKVERGVSRFLQKINVGYTHYFNLKHKRSGVLFQGKTKKIPILDDGHLFYILHYIHANPLDTKSTTRGWREYSLVGVQDALETLDAYIWSSYHAYIRNIPDGITNTGFFNKMFQEGNTSYKKSFFSFLKDVEENHVFTERELE